MTTDGKDQDKARSEQTADNVSRENESPSLSEDNRAPQSLWDESPQTEEILLAKIIAPTSLRRMKYRKLLTRKLIVGTPR